MRKVLVVVGLAAIGLTLVRMPAIAGQISRPGVRPSTSAARSEPVEGRRSQLAAREIFSGFRSGSELGVSIRDVAPDDVAKMKLPAEAGAVIEDVRRGGPADTAGLRQADVVVEFDGEKVRSTAHLARLVRETPAGRHVKATVIRAGRRTEVTIVPVAADAVRVPFNSDDLRDTIERALPMRRPTLGVTTQTMTPELADYFGARSGVLVTSVAKESPAERAGLKVGDVITNVAGQSVASPREFAREIQSRQGEISITIIRDRKEMTLKATVEARTGRLPPRGL